MRTAWYVRRVGVVGMTCALATTACQHVPPGGDDPPLRTAKADSAPVTTATADSALARVPRPASGTVPSTSFESSTPVRITVRNRYYARAGKRDDVYRWRVHASRVLRQLGLTPGFVYRGAGGSEPDAVWEVTLDSAALLREGAIANASPAFQAVMQRMGELTRRFETTTSRETKHFVEVSGSEKDSDGIGSLEHAARSWIASEQDAFARKDATAFQPCRDSAVIVLVDVARAPHACIAVQRHMRDRMAEMESGAMRVRIDSVIVRLDTGLVYDDVHFERVVRHADGSVHRHASDVAHRDVWRWNARAWDLIRMEELSAPSVTIDGRPIGAVSGTTSSPASGDLAGIPLGGAQWPAGFVGAVVPHGAVFSRE